MNVLPLYFLIFALIAGSGLLAVLYVIFAPATKDTHVEITSKLGRITLSALIFGAIASAFSGMISLNSNVPAQADALQMIFSGPNQFNFWTLFVGLGVLVPTILLFIWPKVSKVIGIAAGLAILALAAVPYNIIIAGQNAYSLAGTDAFTGFGLQLGYSPTSLEWQVTVFAIGVGLAILLIGYYLLPVRTLEMEG